MQICINIELWLAGGGGPGRDRDYNCKYPQGPYWDSENILKLIYGDSYTTS